MLVDNASMDWVSWYIQSHYPQVRIVRNKQNLGWLRQQCRAREATSPYVVFLNNDMWIDPEFVHGLVKAVQSAPDVVCAGAKIQ